jgi:hypothetical protein
MALSEDQAQFLIRHSVPFSRVIDAAGMQGKRLIDAMHEADALVAVNTNSCSRAYSHRMKLRSGHCFQCKPESLGFILRHERRGTVYVAFSAGQSLVKVGSASSLYDRLSELNRKRYGGVADWQPIFSERVTEAGRVESAAHASLRLWRADRSYYWGGVHRDCYEIYECTSDQAVNAIKQAIGRTG